MDLCWIYVGDTPMFSILLVESGYTAGEKIQPVPAGHRENRDLMHVSSEDLFGDPLHVRGEKGE